MGVRQGELAPEFEAVLADGSPRRLSDYSGRALLLISLRHLA